MNLGVGHNSTHKSVPSAVRIADKVMVVLKFESRSV